MPGKYLYLTFIVVLAVAFLLGAAFRVWRKRAAEQGLLLAAPADSLALDPVSSFSRVQYVATTLTDDPLNRVMAHGLGFRGWAQLEVGPQGVWVKRQGERDFAIEASKVRKVALDSATIDRAVEKDGLIRLDWLHDQHELSTFLRPKSAKEKDEILSAINAVISKEAIQ
jgi:hypothetical protein